ncbi:CHAT domain-containing protein [Polaribacter vadi]|uniref:CHAT domain-containing protein n=1 Tax=Polaribacter vadi TaxID=1774273 RepID=UPI0030EE648E|tara:strand:+ start:26847 stop:28163 length:1317 start_codon:yes stop_codon:yes gene_type:complete
MIKKISFILCVFFSIICFSQEFDSTSKIVLNQLVEEHEFFKKELVKSRGAVYNFEADEVFFENMFKSNNMLGIIVYTYINDSLKLSLFFNADKEKISVLEKKIKIKRLVLDDYIEDANYLFSSTFLNRAPKKRGTIVTVEKTKKKQLLKTFKKLNEVLLPNDFDLERFNHLIIVPSLNIGTLPFAAFKVKNSYLIDEMSYSIAPNLSGSSLLYDLEETKMNYSWENALFVSNPKYPENTAWNFPDLPGAEEEVNYVINKAKPINFTRLNGTDATKTSVLKNIVNYDLLYFATHGITDAENPLDKSFLVLANDDKETSFITSREIQNIPFKERRRQKLKAKLVVLSACQTGLGKSHEGGTIGLARAFQLAGANHVLMSLWNIDDKETATLMKYFFDELAIAQELMPHAALRNAILKYKKEINDNPKYWAAFSIFGVPYY